MEGFLIDNYRWGYVVIIILAITAVTGCINPCGAAEVMYGVLDWQGFGSVADLPEGNLSELNRGVGFSLADPAPRGTTVTSNFLMSGYDPHIDSDYCYQAQDRITVIDVRRGAAEVSQLLGVNDSERYPVEEGRDHIYIKIRYEFVGTNVSMESPWDIADWDFKIHTSDNGDYQHSDQVYGIIAFPHLNTLMELKKRPFTIEGWIHCEVYTSDPEPVLEYNGHPDVLVWLSLA